MNTFLINNNQERNDLNRCRVVVSIYSVKALYMATFLGNNKNEYTYRGRKI